MEIIPVIDLMEGQVVHARAGRRDSYRPISSPLCSSPEPAAVMEAFLRLSPFRTIYLADLDGIVRGRPQGQLIEALQASYPQVEFWVDGGIPQDGPLSWTPVIGSESLDGVSWRAIREWAVPWILSLDRVDGHFQGPAEILEQEWQWPERIIHMNLSRVGCDQGPDLDGLRELAARVPAHRLVAAGGVRGAADLAELQQLGIGRVLVASSLHSGALLPLPERKE